MRFNTGALLPGNATVSSAMLAVEVVEPPMNADGLSLTGEWYNWGPTVGPEDYSEAPFSSAFSVPVSSISIGRNTIPLSGAAANVSLTGYTYLRTHVSQRPGDAAPTGNNRVRIALFDNTNLAGPALTVCYSTSGPLPTRNATPTATRTPAVTSPPTVAPRDVEDGRYLPPNTWVRLETVPSLRFVPRETTDCTRMRVLSHPVGRRASSIVYGGSIFYWGGNNNSHPGNDVELFDIAANIWTQQYQPECFPSCCLPGRCLTGEGAGRICDSDPDCLDSECTEGQCYGGTNNGNPCAHDSGCPNGSCWALTCSGGSLDGVVCRRDEDCPDGACPTCDDACAFLYTGVGTSSTPMERPYVEKPYQVIAYNPLRKKYTAALTPGLWEWDPSTGDWTRLTPDRPESTDSATKMLVYDPDLQTVLYFATTQFNHTVFRFDYATNTWLPHGPIPNEITTAQIFSAYDSNEHKYLVSHGTRTMWIYDAMAGTWTRLLNVPAEALFSFSLAYDPIAGVFLLGKPDLTGKVQLWSYQVVTDTWSKVEPVAGAPAGPTPDSNLLVYDHVWKRFYFLNARSAGGGGEGGTAEGDVQTWAFRIGGPVGPGDADCDGRVTAADLPNLIQSFGLDPTEGCSVLDNNRDGAVNEADLPDTIAGLFAAP